MRIVTGNRDTDQTNFMKSYHPSTFSLRSVCLFVFSFPLLFVVLCFSVVLCGVEFSLVDFSLVSQSPNLIASIAGHTSNHKTKEKQHTHTFDREYSTPTKREPSVAVTPQHTTHAPSRPSSLFDPLSLIGFHYSDLAPTEGEQVHRAPTNQSTKTVHRVTDY